MRRDTPLKRGVNEMLRRSVGGIFGLALVGAILATNAKAAEYYTNWAVTHFSDILPQSDRCLIRMGMGSAMWWSTQWGWIQEWRTERRAY